MPTPDEILGQTISRYDSQIVGTEIANLEDSIARKYRAVLAKDLQSFFDNRKGFVSSVVNSRAANVTPYTANDVWGGLMEFQNIAPPEGGLIQIRSTDIVFSFPSIPPGMGGLRMVFFTERPTVQQSDNDPFSLNPLDANKVYTPSINFLSTNLFPVGGNVVIASNISQTPFPAKSSSIWAYLTTAVPYTPANPSESCTIRLCATPLI